MEEIFFRYAIPRLEHLIKKKSPKNNELAINDKSDEINSGHADLINYCRERAIPLIVFMHPERTEYDSEEYNENGHYTLELLKKEK